MLHAWRLKDILIEIDANISQSSTYSYQRFYKLIKKYYNIEKKSIMCFFEKAPEGNYWNKRWNEEYIAKAMERAEKASHITNISKKYLSKGARVIEGGCGFGQKVLSLCNAGYSVVGVDNANKAIEMGKKFAPEDIDMRVGDMRHLDFPDQTFDGYWSIGVIEHDIYGFGEILNEMYRVLKSDGYLFLSFPVMSGLRKLKVRRASYPIATGKLKAPYFYQYIYDAQFVLKQFEHMGFCLVWKDNINQALGLADEVGAIGRILNKTFRTKVANYCVKVCRIMINIGLKRISPEFSAHSVYFVLQKGRS